MSFWYNMYGADVGSLKIYTTTDLTSPTQQTDLLWGRFGQISESQNQWLHGKTPLNTTDTFRVSV